MDGLYTHLGLTYTSFTTCGKLTDTAHSHPILVAFGLFEEEQSANLKAQTRVE